MIPCGLYGDEAKYADGPPQEKVLGIYMNFVLFRPATVRHSRFMIFALRSQLMVDTVHTLYPLFWKVVESLHFAYLGKRPDGSQLCADGARFMVTELRGDLAYQKLCWQFPQRGWTSLDVCFFCNARAKGELLYTNLGQEADWKASEFTNVWEWAANTLPEKLCDLARDRVSTFERSDVERGGLSEVLGWHCQGSVWTQSACAPCTT